MTSRESRSGTGSARRGRRRCRRGGAGRGVVRVCGDLLARGSGQVFGEVGEGRVEQREQRAEGVVLAAVRGRGDEDEVAVLVAAERRSSSWRWWRPRAVAPNANVWASSTITSSGQARTKSLAAAVGLDEVRRDDDVRVLLEERLADRQAALEPLRRARAGRARRRGGTSSAARAATARRGAAGRARRAAGRRRGRAFRGRSGAASMVLPIPTSSAISSRTGSSLSAISSGTSW